MSPSRFPVTDLREHVCPVCNSPLYVAFLPASCWVRVQPQGFRHQRPDKAADRGDSVISPSPSPRAPRPWLDALGVAVAAQLTSAHERRPRGPRKTRRAGPMRRDNL